MKDIIEHQIARFMVYLALSFLSMTTIYGTFFVTKNYQQIEKNRIAIDQIEKRILEREVVAAKYIPMLEGTIRLQNQHSDILKRIMDRQKDINKIIEKPLKKKN